MAVTNGVVRATQLALRSTTSAPVVRAVGSRRDSPAIPTASSSSRRAARLQATPPSTRCSPAIPSQLKNERSRRLTSSNSTGTASYSTSAPSPDNKFVYNVAASYIAKGRAYDPSTHTFQFNPYNRVQPPKGGRGKASRPESGQDAFFVSRLGSHTGEVAVGVADGVGGWMDSGVDPADFSHAFCDYMAAAATAAAATMGGTGKPLTARQLMQKGYEAVCHDPAIKAGGSTAVVGLLTANGTLEVANLGDSGFIVLRLNGVHASSEPQTHAFNTPYQLSVVPPSMLLRAAAFGGAQLMDQPRDAEVTRHRLRHGDVLIFASDGLWDNLFNQDVLRIVSRTMTKVGAWESTDRGVQVVPDLRPYTGLAETNATEERAASNRPLKPDTTLQSTLATQIVAAAKAASVNRRLDGPFAKEVKKYYPHEIWHGGKEDDICVVVVLVSEEEAPTKTKL
ncbi:Protein phosphatase 2C 7, mitochondrial [Madurella mycetomatis]|uniref:Protein phosphatase n=1 Tax=Madurella mycetomatis TaxID=100816 RepID=A0A175W370_9PEZI|nr:Protein phosphatase 2C 7, mitochondrial [Madurella mycetomatis]